MSDPFKDRLDLLFSGEKVLIEYTGDTVIQYIDNAFRIYEEAFIEEIYSHAFLLSALEYDNFLTIRRSDEI